MPLKPVPTTLPSLPEDPDVAESLYAGLTSFLSAVRNHIAPDPDEVSQSDSTHTSGAQRLGQSTALPSQPTTMSQQAGFLKQCSTKWPGSHFVPANFYNGQFTVHSDITNKSAITEDQIELKPILGCYDTTNKMLVCISPDGEMMYKSTLGAQHFIGSRGGQDTNIFVGCPEELVWTGDGTKGEAISCAGAWGAVVRREVPAP